jgi:CheY-like chemotaxis protein
MGMPVALGRRMARVLVINDDESILRVYEDLLRELGHEVVAQRTVASGPDTIGAVRADALIVDLQRPEEAEYGLRIIEELREDPATRAFPIVLATGATQLPEPERLQALDVRIVRKPFAIDDIDSALSQSLRASEAD